MLSKPEANERLSSFTDESYDEQGFFEVIPPMVTVSNKPRTNSVPPSKRPRSETKTPASSSLLRKQRVFPFKPSWVVIPVLFLLVWTASLFYHKTSSPNDIQDLRLEFKRDLESLRTDVENELVAHLLAAAEVKKAAQQRAIELESQAKSSSHHSELFTTKPESHLEPPHRGRIQFMDALPSFDWSHESMVRPLETMVSTTVSFWNSVQSKIQAQTQSIGRVITVNWESNRQMILRQIPSINVTAITTDWDQEPALQEAIEFVHEHRLELCAWFLTLLLLLCSFVRCSSSRISDKDCNERTSNHKAKGSANQDEESIDECSNNPDPPERLEDILMEHMFQDSVAAAASGNWPVVAPRVYTGGDRNGTKRNPSTRSVRSSTNGHSSQPIPVNGSRIEKISKEERRRRARINAQQFAARDKQRLDAASLKKPKAASPSPAKTPTNSMSKEERRRRARIHALEFAARDKQRLRQAAKERNRNL